MSETIGFLGAGVVFGLSAGFSPGPLMALVISQSLRHGAAEGMKAAFAPLATDLPIILVSVLVLSRLSMYRPVLGGIAILGGLFVAFLAWGTFRANRVSLDARDAAPRNSLLKGAAVNALSPHPWLFWLTVGAPTLLKAWAGGAVPAAAFVAGFYACLVGAKVALALLAGRAGERLQGSAYRCLMRILGALLLVFAVWLLRDGLQLLGVCGAASSAGPQS
jgi:threonine/homoserine/homoserine lactone efflux protein